MLAARGLTKRFGERTAVKDVSLDAARGERVAIIGPNGAGKTTLLSLLAGHAKPDGGEVDLGPKDIGWVPQQTALYGTLSVEENLRLFARLEKVPDVDATVGAMLDQTGLRDRAREELSTLSGGNRQRVNLAVGMLAAMALGVSAKHETKAARKSAVLRAVKEVAHYLANTPAVARASYIDPRLFDRFEDGVSIAPTLEHFGEFAVDADRHHVIEQAVLDLIDDDEDAAGVGSPDDVLADGA